MGFKYDSGVLIGHIEEKHTRRKGDSVKMESEIELTTMRNSRNHQKL